MLEATPIDLADGGHDLKPSDGERPTIQRIHQERQERNVRRELGPRRCFICGFEVHFFPNTRTRDVPSATPRHTVSTTILVEGGQDTEDDGEGRGLTQTSVLKISGGE